MSWKKNVFSYLLWVFYAVVAEAGLVCLADVACDLLGSDIHRGTVACALYIGAAGAAVALVHRFAPKYSGADGKRNPARTAAGTAAVLILLAAGIALRAQEMQAAGAAALGEGSGYYLQAVMVPQGELPQAVNGVAGIYMSMLHGLFFFLGNKPAAAVWVQILLQMGGLALLYLALRRLSGNVAALVTLAFGVLSSYCIREALILSPAMLYFFFWAAVLLLISIAAGMKKSPPVFCAAGFLAACAGYLDAAGSLLLWIAAAVIFCKEDPGADRGGKPVRILSCCAGAAAGFLICGVADSGISGQSFGGAMEASLMRYTPAGLRMPFSTTPAEALTEYIVLFCILVLGIFSFWRNGESDHMKGWILLMGIVALAGCSGIFSDEIPMGLYMYLLLAVMAGIAVEECIRTVPVAEAEAAAPVAARGDLAENSAPGEEPPMPEEERELKEAERQELEEEEKQEREEKKKQELEEEKGQESEREEEKQRGPEPEEGKEQESEPEEGKAPGKQEPVQKPVQMIENPLPLPRKHVRKKMDYGMAVPDGQDDFDYEVDDGDDFDI